MKKIRSLFVVLSVLILSGCRSSHPVQRYGSVIGLKKEAMAEDQAQFETLLGSLLSTDNNVRTDIQTYRRIEKHSEIYNRY